MIRNIRKKISNQKGFTLVELMVVIAILGILAAIAVPRFANQTTSANTAKIAADLRTIDGAITMAVADGRITAATVNTNIPTLLVTNHYIAVWPVPPTGDALRGATTVTIAPATTPYVAVVPTGEAAPNFRASLDGHYAEEWHR